MILDGHPGFLNMMRVLGHIIGYFYDVFVQIFRVVMTLQSQNSRLSLGKGRVGAKTRQNRVMNHMKTSFGFMGGGFYPPMGNQPISTHLPRSQLSQPAQFGSFTVSSSSL